MNNQKTSEDHSQQIENQMVGVQEQSLRTAIRFDSKGVFLSYSTAALIFFVFIGVAVAAVGFASVTHKEAKPPCVLDYYKETINDWDAKNFEREFIKNGWKVEKESYVTAGRLEITFSRCK